MKFRTCTLRGANRDLGVVAYERSDFRNCDRTFSDCLNKLGGGPMMLYKCVWFTPLINFREATRGKGRTDRKVGSTGLTKRAAGSPYL